MSTSNHKAGFVSIVGKPNVGKSTLMNVLVGERLSIITSKAQTTRHRIMGIISGDDFQIVYSDTPGIIKPKYKLHESMMNFVTGSLIDADVVLFVTDIYEKFDEEDVIEKLRKSDRPILLIVNKIDQVKEQSEIEEKMAYWAEHLNPTKVIAISALEKFNTDAVLNFILDNLPEHEPYFPKDTLTDKPERFFVSEIVREKIFINYKKEIPYCCEVLVEDFIESDDIIRIRVVILVERKSQKGIIIGHKGEAIKRIGIQARAELEKFFEKQIYLEQFVKVDEDWRKQDRALKRLGYKNK